MWLPIFLWIVQTIFFVHYCFFQFHAIPFLLVKVKFPFNLFFQHVFCLRIANRSPVFSRAFKTVSPFLTKETVISLIPSQAYPTGGIFSWSLCVGLACSSILYMSGICTHEFPECLPWYSFTFDYQSEQDHPFVWFTCVLMFFKLYLRFSFSCLTLHLVSSYWH